MCSRPLRRLARLGPSPDHGNPRDRRPGRVHGRAQLRWRADATEVSAAPITVAPRTRPGGPRAVGEYLADRTVRLAVREAGHAGPQSPTVKGHKFRTAKLNLWAAPRESGKPLDDARGARPGGGHRRPKAGFAEILYAGQIRWVKAAYLVDKPAQARARGRRASAARLEDSAPRRRRLERAVPRRVRHRVGPVLPGGRLYRSECNAFPALSSYGGYDAHGEHSNGKAIDIMITDPARSGRSPTGARPRLELDLYDIIWAQRIWTPVRAGEGWRSMSDRGLRHREPLRPRAHRRQLSSPTSRPPEVVTVSWWPRARRGSSRTPYTGCMQGCRGRSRSNLGARCRRSSACRCGSAPAEPVQGRHGVMRELEPADVGIASDPVRTAVLGDHHEAVLQVGPR